MRISYVKVNNYRNIDGIEVTKRIRQEKITTYILILTARMMSMIRSLDWN